MENSFWGIVGIPLQIKTIKEDSLSKALEIVYNDDDYLFRNSRWFVDIKNCFRIFNLNGTTYISKKTSEEKADQEIVNSTHAFEKLNGRKIGAIFLRIVIPQKIKSISSNNQCYIVSEYVGTDLNEFVYSGSISPLSLAECLSIIKLLLESGIAHRGFLPRNTVVNDEAIYLFDWEDARFDLEQDHEIFDHLWRTNFLLNWSYLFGFNELDNGLKKYVGIRYLFHEPSLVKYESTFKELTNNSDSTPQLRDVIDKIVFGAELPLTGKTNSFYIRPNDMGHLVADIFPSEIDVLHDLLAFSFRQNNEKRFVFHIRLMTHMLTLYFRATLLQNQNLNHPIQFYALIPIIMMLDEYVAEEEYSSLLLTNDLETLVSGIYKMSGKSSIVNLYLSDGPNDLTHPLAASIQDKISQACHIKVDRNNERLSAIVNFVNEHKR